MNKLFSVVLAFILGCVVAFAAQPFTSQVNLGALTWTSNIDQAAANKERAADVAYYFFQIGRTDLLEKDNNEAFVVTADGDPKPLPSLTNPQIAQAISDSLKQDFKTKSDDGAVTFQTARIQSTISTARRAKANPQ